ncbi:MAG: hypothetical protein AB2747_07850 [Candidatus Thiodiazotropha taylori]
MATNKDFDEPFFIDIGPELERVDRGFSELLKDREASSAFLSDPIGVMVKLGIIKGIDQKDSSRANKIFYTLLANKELVSIIIDFFEHYESPEGIDNAKHYAEGLKDGEIRNLLEHEFDIIDELLQKPSVLERAFNLAVSDLNENDLLSRKLSNDEINNFVQDTLAAAVERRALKEFPVLPDEEGHYSQPLAAVVGPVAVAVVAAQAAAGATAIVAITNPTIGSFEQLAKSTFSGNEEDLKALALLGRLFDLTAELAVHIQSYEEGRK